MHAGDAHSQAGGLLPDGGGLLLAGGKLFGEGLLDGGELFGEGLFSYGGGDALGAAATHMLELH